MSSPKRGRRFSTKANQSLYIKKVNEMMLMARRAHARTPKIIVIISYWGYYFYFAYVLHLATVVSSTYGCQKTAAQKGVWQIVVVKSTYFKNVEVYSFAWSCKM